MYFIILPLGELGGLNFTLAVENVFKFIFKFVGGDGLDSDVWIRQESDIIAGSVVFSKFVLGFALGSMGGLQTVYFCPKNQFTDFWGAHWFET